VHVPNACTMADKVKKQIKAGKKPELPAKMKKQAGKNFQSTMQNAVAASAKRLNGMMRASKELSVDGQGFVQHIMNPCGEHTIPNARCTDGTLSQSAVQTLRAEDFIVPPFTNTATVGDTTKNWTLIEISPPTYTGVSLFIASANAAQPSIEEWRVIFSQINSTGVANYPSWTTIGDPASANYYASYWRYESANLMYDPQTNQSTSVESFRFVGDGLVLHHNSPTLWDQGGFVTGQFQCDTEYFSEPGEIATLTIQSSATAVATNQITLTNFNIGMTSDIAQFLSVNNLPIANGATSSQATIVYGQPYNIRKPDGNFLVNVGASANFNWAIKYQYGANPTISISTPTTQGGPLVLPVDNVPLVNTSTYSTTELLGATLANASVIIDLPSLDWSRIVQADPKRASDLMKGHLGFYSVRRYFQPKLLMARSNTSGNIKFSVQGMDRLAIVRAKGGILNDLIDVNGAIRISVIRGISYGAQPQAKADRFIELMPAPGSILASVTEVTPARDEDAEEVFRSLQSRGAHAYVPDANLLGEMAAFLNAVISRIPVVARTVRSISAAVESAAEWVEAKTKFLE